MTATTPIRWGILGPGSIAQAFAGGVAASRTGTLVAIGARNPGKPGLAEAFPGARIVDGYEALLADPDIDAIYIAIPHPGHAQWAIRAAEAGKHVLCEKPLALTAFEADAMIHAARKAGTFLGEAFMYRLHPQTLKLVELIKSGVIGEIRMIKSSFGFAMPRFMPEHRLYANESAGGGILDVGGYTVSMARLIAGAASGQPLPSPTRSLARLILANPALMNGPRHCCIFPAASSPRSPAASRSTRTMCCASSAPRAASRCRTSGSPGKSRCRPRPHRRDRR